MGLDIPISVIRFNDNKSTLKTKCNILVSPYSRKLRNGSLNPKNYPYWPIVLQSLVQNNYIISQLVYEGEQYLDYCAEHLTYDKIQDAEVFIQNCDILLSVDNWCHHYTHIIKKPTVVIFSRSNPEIFGYPEQTNLLKDKKYLRPRQFEWWELDTYTEDAFVEPKIVVDAVMKLTKNEF